MIFFLFWLAFIFLISVGPPQYSVQKTSTPFQFYDAEKLPTGQMNNLIHIYKWICLAPIIWAQLFSESNIVSMTNNKNDFLLLSKRNQLMEKQLGQDNWRKWAQKILMKKIMKTSCLCSDQSYQLSQCDRFHFSKENKVIICVGHASVHTRIGWKQSVSSSHGRTDIV